jgi:hypothetical protein
VNISSIDSERGIDMNREFCSWPIEVRETLDAFSFTPGFNQVARSNLKNYFEPFQRFFFSRIQETVETVFRKSLSCSYHPVETG